METIKDRMQAYLSINKITDYKAEKDLCKPRGTWGKVKNPSANLIEAFVQFYSDINPAWLLTGEGSMLRGEQTTQPAPAASTTETELQAKYDELTADHNKLMCRFLSTSDRLNEQLEKNSVLEERIKELENKLNLYKNKAI